jgi:2-isopropylmalate synthase
MSRTQKLRMARALADLGVDILEAGFPAASEDDCASVKAIAAAVRGPRICGLARCQASDIESVARAIEPAQKGRIHIFLATSPLHREFKLQMSRQQVIDTAVAGVERALACCDDVEFSAEDALRTEPEFLAEVFSAVIAAGAGTVNVPDTVGYTTPIEIAERFAWLYANVRGADSVVFSAHCHDDLGMAVANSLAAISAGARQVECTINGIGERAGNAALEELVMALRVRSDHFGGLHSAIRTHRLHATARLLSQITSQPIARNRRSLARPRPRTNRASTSTACSSIAAPTKSCEPKTSAYREANWCLASTVAGTPCANAWRRWDMSSTMRPWMTCSRASSRSPTGSAKSSMPISRRWRWVAIPRRSVPGI